MSLNQSMSITLGSMRNNQYALTVVSQNIANVHVEGYHRQRINFETNEYTTNCDGVISTIRGMNGASVSSLTDFIDEGALNALKNSNSDANYYNTLADGLNELQDIADDLGENGLNGLLNDFFAAAANLEQFPTDMTVRQQFLLCAENVCDKINDIDKKYVEMQEDKYDEIGVQIDAVNSIIQDLATLNEENVKNGGSPATTGQINDILIELSNYGDFIVTKHDNGSCSVNLGNITILDGSDIRYTLGANFDSSADTSVQFKLTSTTNPNKVLTQQVNEQFLSGSMKGYIDLLNGSGENFSNVNDMKASLNHLASVFAEELNNIQTYDDGVNFAASLVTGGNGFQLEKSQTKLILASNDPTADVNASNISVNSEMFDNPLLIAAARINSNNFKDVDGNPDESWKDAVGNSDNAVQFTALQDKKVCVYGDGGKNQTLSQFLTANAAKNGMDAANMDNKASVYQDMADADRTNYVNLIGVNLDEELADMLKYQRSYEASARLFSTIDSLIQTIINMV